MIRILLALFLAVGVASGPIACGGSGNNPQPSGGLGY
jgi:hypothetical protein